MILIYDISDEKLLFYTRDYQFHYTILVTRKYYSTLQIIDFDIPYWRHEISILHSALLILIYHFSNGKLLFCTRDYWFWYAILASRNYYSKLRISNFDIQYCRWEITFLYPRLSILIYDINHEKLLFYTWDYWFWYTILAMRNYYSTLTIIDFDTILVMGNYFPALEIIDFNMRY